MWQEEKLRIEESYYIYNDYLFGFYLDFFVFNFFCERYLLLKFVD